MKEKINIVVVTYNRKELLLECINALINQTYKWKKIFIIDNNSTDGTFELLEQNKILDNKNIIYKKLEKNVGGAGGFHEGMKIAYKDGADWIWVMDDDTIPTTTALQNLIEGKSHINENISFLSSSAWDIEEKNPINHGKINYRTDKEGYLSYRKYLEYGIFGLENATFVACLVNCKAIEQCGFPIKDYFIWGDDIEYTTRLTLNFGNAYQIGSSKVIHKRTGKIINSIKEEENKNRLKFWFYMIRNTLITQKEYEKFKVFKTFLKYQLISIYCLFNPKIKYRLKKFIIIHKALLTFLLKKYDYKAVKNRFLVEGEKNEF